MKGDGKLKLQMAAEGPDRHDDAKFLRRTLTAMRNYQEDCRVAYKHRSLAACSQEHRARLIKLDYADYLRRVSDCVESNQGSCMMLMTTSFGGGWTIV